MAFEYKSTATSKSSSTKASLALAASSLAISTVVLVRLRERGNEVEGKVKGLVFPCRRPKNIKLKKRWIVSCEGSSGASIQKK